MSMNLSTELRKDRHHCNTPPCSGGGEKKQVASSLMALTNKCALEVEPRIYAHTNCCGCCGCQRQV